MNMNDYNNFISTKTLKIKPCGFDADISELPECLFDYQKAVVKWALAKGKCAVFAGTGLGKTLMELSWAKTIFEKTKKNVLILAPLAVAEQIKDESDAFQIRDVFHNRTGENIKPGITVTNYEKIHKFDLSLFDAVVLDESSILKSFDGKTRSQLIDSFQSYSYRLAATATPAPNDFMELGNHAEFLSIMSYSEMLAMFFVHDGGETQNWRLKGHAKKAFWKWMASWSVMFESPYDLGFDGSKHILPELRKHNIIVKSDIENATDTLFRFEAITLQERIKERRNSIDDRCQKAAEIVNASPDSPWVIWCNMNAESDLLEKLIPTAKQINGSMPEEKKEDYLRKFKTSEIKDLVTKPSLSGFGLNWQHANKMIFVGLNDSWEQVYQAIRRCWRFGQKKPVDVYFVSAELEGNVIANLERKDKQSPR